jgi:hypothetical protein
MMASRSLPCHSAWRRADARARMDVSIILDGRIMSSVASNGSLFGLELVGATTQLVGFAAMAQSFLNRSHSNTFAAIGNPCAHSGTSISIRSNSLTLPTSTGTSAPISSWVCSVST